MQQFPLCHLAHKYREQANGFDEGINLTYLYLYHISFVSNSNYLTKALYTQQYTY